eukprot:478125-Prymnesium_polylepis.1
MKERKRAAGAGECPEASSIQGRNPARAEGMVWGDVQPLTMCGERECVASASAHGFLRASSCGGAWGLRVARKSVWLWVAMQASLDLPNRSPVKVRDRIHMWHLSASRCCDCAARSWVQVRLFWGGTWLQQRRAWRPCGGLQRVAGGLIVRRRMVACRSEGGTDRGQACWCRVRSPRRRDRLVLAREWRVLIPPGAASCGRGGGRARPSRRAEAVHAAPSTHGRAGVWRRSAAEDTPIKGPLS